MTCTRSGHRVASVLSSRIIICSVSGSSTPTAFMARAYTRQDPFVIWGDGSQIRDWIHVSDIVSGLLAAGEKIDHGDGMTVEEAEHQIATRLYQNTARVHFNQFAEARGRFGRRLVYGGHVMSLARALSFNGLANGFHIAAINGGRHVAPLFAGGTVFAWSEILATAEIPGRADVGALRVLTRATRDLPCAEFPTMEATPDGAGVILELDYWVLMPR